MGSPSVLAGLARLCGARAAAVLSAAALAVAALADSGCGVSRSSAGATDSSATSAGERAVALDRSRTRPVGGGRAFRPPPYGTLVASAARLGALRCRRSGGHPYGVHVELFAAGRVVIVPAGIGLAPPQRRDGATVSAGRCAYPLRTVEPTGVVRVDAGRDARRVPTLGELFGLWGQPLDANRLAGFRPARAGGVIAYVGGRRWRADPRTIPLQRHAQIVLEVGPHVDPHPAYRFAPGL